MMNLMSRHKARTAPVQSRPIARKGNTPDSRPLALSIANTSSEGEADCYCNNVSMFSPSHPLFDAVLRGLILGPLTLLWITALTRMIGLRTFSKMTAFDFVATIATGSLLAQAAGSSDWKEFIQAVIAVAMVLTAQRIIAAIRFRSDSFRDAIENEPILLMSRGSFHRKAMAKVRVSEADIRTKLRQANVADPDQVEAVVLETTGDISVLHGESLAKGFLEGIPRGPDYDETR